MDGNRDGSLVGGNKKPASDAEIMSTDLGIIPVCPKQTIPMRRLTLEDMTGHHTINAFFMKRTQNVSAWDPQHHWTVAEQFVGNYGSSSQISINGPIGDFSLSQQWYVNGTGCQLQTCESGWLVYPTYFNTSAPVLFIYYTNNSYGINNCKPNGWQFGCYDLSCPAFMQYDSTYILGSTLPTSNTNSTTEPYTFSWVLTSQWLWWFVMTHDNVTTWIGYYDANKVFNGGAMSTGASSIQFGGEVARMVDTPTWPSMGSGQYANSTGAALHQKIDYYPSAYPYNGTLPNLTIVTTSSCYTGLLNTNNTIFAFGGPGGTTDQC